MKAKVLIADDSTTIQKFIRMTLSKFDLSLYGTTSLTEAKAVVRQDKLDLMLIDSCLAGVKSAEEIIELQSAAGGVPVIVLVGSFEGTPAEELRAKGLEHIIRKPFDPAVLTDLVLKVLQGFDAEGSNAQVGSLSHDLSGIPLPDTETSLPRDDLEELIMKNEIESRMELDEITELVRNTVSQYCEKHFRAIAKEVIQSEIKSLIAEQERHSIDN